MLLEVRDQRLLEAFGRGLTSIADDVLVPGEGGKPLRTRKLVENWRRCAGYSTAGSREERLVRKGGLEPPPLAGPDPKSGASANSATFAIPADRLLYNSFRAAIQP